jgi:hypothetical protein
LIGQKLCCEILPTCPRKNKILTASERLGQFEQIRRTWRPNAAALIAASGHIVLVALLVWAIQNGLKHGSRQPLLSRQLLVNQQSPNRPISP